MVSSHRILGRVHAASLRQGLVAAVMSAAALAGCGQKGPLFLPVPPVLPAPTTTAPISAPIPAPSSPVPPASAAK
ncbi:lipoprotein [Polaromonas sp.]|uniref:LPS translocon maturation chaperone LptM n=1 Tax=Polaromonas sp. TaxID=1869339 RepID=UPI0017C54D66|nr:lipoprotein [Polaromonas sp.]NMM08232.1 hypothetical protein [Polaromonas sp.]